MSSVCLITHTRAHTNPLHKHTSPIPGCMQRTLQQQVLPPTHSISSIYFTTECQTFAYIYMHAGGLSVCRRITASIFPSLHAPPPIQLIPCFLHPSLHTWQAYSKVTHLNYSVRAHTCTESERRSVIGGEDKKGRGGSRFHATMSTG